MPPEVQAVKAMGGGAMGVAFLPWASHLTLGARFLIC